jgi:hypothetical protein
VPAMQRRYAGPLVAGALRYSIPRCGRERTRSLALLDGALELLMPPYSVLVAGSAVNLILAAALSRLLPSVRGLLGVTGSACMLGAWLLYPLLGLLIDRAPAWTYRAALLGPAYVAWRLWIAVLVRLRGDRIGWVRTQRREEGEPSDPADPAGCSSEGAGWSTDSENAERGAQ